MLCWSYYRMIYCLFLLAFKKKNCIVLNTLVVVVVIEVHYFPIISHHFPIICPSPWADLSCFPLYAHSTESLTLGSTIQHLLPVRDHYFTMGLRGDFLEKLHNAQSH